MSLLGKLFGRSGRSEDRTLATLHQHLDEDFTIFPLAETQTSPLQLEEIGGRYGVKYPPELTDHICGQFPGVYVEVKERVWTRPKAFDVAPSWSFLYGVHSYTSSRESQGWMRLDVAAATFQKNHRLPAAPVLKVIGDADLYCVNADGDIVRHDHEANALEPVPLDFWGLFEREIAALRARKDRTLEEAATRS